MRMFLGRRALTRHHLRRRTPGRQRQPHHELRAAAESAAAGLHLAAMQPHERSHQRQPQAQAAVCAGGLGSLAERLEDVGKIGRLDARAGIPHRQRHMIRFVRDRQVNPAPVGRVLHRVRQQVVHNLRQTRAIALHIHGGGRQMGRVGQLPVRRSDLHVSAADPAHFHQVQRFELQMNPALANPREIQQPVDQRPHVPALTLQDGVRPRHQRLVALARLQERRRVPDRRQRIAQLVPKHRQEQVLLATGFAQRFVGAFALGDVAGDLGRADQTAVAAPDGRDGQRHVHQASRLGAPHRLEVLDALASAQALQQPALFGVPLRRDDDVDRLPHHLLGAVAEETLGARVPGADGAVQQLADDRVVGARHHRRQEGVLLLDGGQLLVVVAGEPAPPNRNLSNRTRGLSVTQPPSGLPHHMAEVSRDCRSRGWRRGKFPAPAQARP